MVKRARLLPFLVLAAPLLLGVAKITVISDTLLNNPELRFANDVRWSSAEKVFIGSGQVGVVEWDTVKARLSDGKVVPGGSAGIWLTYHIGLSDRYVVAAAPAFSFLIRDRAQGKQESVSVAVIEDIDVHDDRVAVLGANRNDAGVWSPDGAMAWIGSLEKPADLTPILFAAAGGRSKSMSHCHFLQLGAVRFLGDGSLFVVAGVEPGIYLFDPAGKLKRTWPTSALGFEDHCSLGDDEYPILARDPVARDSWRNAHTLLDDLFVLDGRPALITRTRHGTSTTWELTVIREDGHPEKTALPITSKSSHARLRVDLRGDRAVFLITEPGIPGVPPEEAPRLLVAEVRR